MKLRNYTPLILLSISSISMAQYQYFTSSAISQPASVSNGAIACGFMGSSLGLWSPVTNAAPTNIGGLSGNGRISTNGLFVAGNSAGPDGKSEISSYNVATGIWTPQGGAGGFSGTTRSSTWTISGDGSTVCGFGYGTYTGTGTGTYTGIRPISFKNGVMTDYSIIQNANSINRIQASNYDGTVVAGRARYLNGTSQLDGSYYWVNGVRNELKNTGGAFLGSPEQVSADGTIIAGSGASSTEITVGTTNFRLPYVYNSITNTYVTIDTIAGQNGNVLPSTALRVDGLITGMSADGNTAVGWFRHMSPSVYIDKTWGFIWTAAGGVTTFDSFCSSNGIAASTDYYMIPTGMSADGNTFVGYTMARVGAPTGTTFMITTVPEPATIAALSLGALAFIRRRRIAN
jgi:hypothetical protein